MEAIIATTFMLSVTAVIVVGSIWFVSAQRKKFAAAFENDPDFEFVPDAWQSSIRTKRAPVVTVTAGGGGKNNPTRWDASSFAPRMGRRTTLHLSREGLTGKLRELAGFKDVRTGDSAFDEHFTIRGAEPDAIRGVLANDEVRAAIAALFEAPAWTVEVRGEKGVVTVRCPRASMNVEQARNVGRCTQALIAALEQHADAPPMREAIASAVGGSATGSPVGVPIGGR